MSPAAEQTNEQQTNEQMSAAGAVSTSTLERLSRIKAEGNPILSVYLDLDPSRFPTPAARDIELSSLLGAGAAGADELDVKHVREAVRTHPELAHGARGLAIFSCAASGVLEVLAVPEPVEPLVVVDSVPWLEPLAAMLASEDWGVAVLSRRDARLFRGGRDGLIEFATVSDELHRRHAQGGWSQANLQRGIEQQVSEHARHAAELLLRAHRRHSFDHVVIVASDELWPVVERSLHKDLRDRLAGVIARDLEHAPERDIARAVAPLIDDAERERERALISRLEQALGTGGPATSGLDEVLATLQEGRVEMLLLADQAKLPAAGSCPSCGGLYASAEGDCRVDGAALAAVDAVEYLTAQAARQSIPVVVARHEPETLRAYGEVAAFLRW
ncbi:MAG: host attachment protein [Solirubrobacteraceae bacterium]